MGKMNVRTKMRNIEFIRIFFAISIVYFHLLHSFMIPFTDETAAYQELALQSRYAKYIVECFFIMSGYFLYRSVLADPGQKTLDFVMKKWIRLWPVLAVSTILSVVFLNVSLQEGFLNLFFLQSTGLTTAWTGLNWYISAFFFAEIFYFMMYKAMKNSAAMKFLICLIVYFGYTLNLVYTEGGFARKVIYGVFSLAMARAVAGVGLGYLLGNFYDALTEKWKTQYADRFKVNIVTILVTVTEIGSFSFLLLDFFAGKRAGKNQFVVVLLFSAFFFCMLTEKGLFSKMIGRLPICKLGKYAYSIYAMQEIAFYILEKTFWKNTEFLKTHVAASLMISMAFAAVTGAVVYHLIEKPASELGKKLLL